jgi:hypothetical protein
MSNTAGAYPCLLPPQLSHNYCCRSSSPICLCEQSDEPESTTRYSTTYVSTCLYHTLARRLVEFLERTVAGFGAIWALAW